LDLRPEKIDERALRFEVSHDLFQITQDERSTVQRFAARLDGGVSVAGGGDEDASGLPTIEDADLVLGHLAGAEPLVPPLNLDHVELDVDFDHTVDLLDDPL
jgi:hypothetical protein